MHRLIVPGLFEPPDRGALPATPLLDHLVARGELVRSAAVGYEELLATCFGLDANDSDVPTGALLANYQGHDAKRQWACVAPVHMQVDRDRLLLFPVEPVSVDSSTIIRLLNTHFRDEGMRFHATSEGPWLVELDAPLVASTCSIDRVAGRSVDPFMPSGKDAGRLRSLMNECQMLLHAHNLPGTVNSLWFWGIGRLPTISRKPLEIFCNELLCKSLAGACDADSEPSDTSLFTTSGCLEGRQYGDMDRWISGLAETEERLRDLLEQQGEELFLQSDNGLALRYRHRMRFRFWKRDSFTKLIQSQGSKA
jgi:hypothetical protein